MKRFCLNKRTVLFVAALLSGIFGLVYGENLECANPYTQEIKPNNLEELLAGFRVPPDSARPLTYWNWINGSVSKEGIAADLEAMRSAGIVGAMIFDANIYVPFGGVVYASKEWNELVRFALKKAEELGMRLYLMNCDGWATAGGPWNTPETSMKKLVWTQTAVVGGKNFSGTLPLPQANENFYRDIGVFLIPLAADYSPAIRAEKNSADLLFKDSSGAQRRHVKIGFSKRTKAELRGVVEVSEDLQTWRKIKDFSFKGRVIGPYLCLTFEPTAAKAFRVRFTPEPPKGLVSIGKSELGCENMVENFHTLTLMDSLYAADTAGIPPAVSGGSAGFIDLGLPSADGSISADIPDGKWLVLRLGYTTTGAKNHPAQDSGKGLETDKLEPSSVRRHLEKSLGTHFENAQADGTLGTSFSGVLCDSWECMSQNWTEKMPEYFQKLRKYSLRGWLPCAAGFATCNPGAAETFLFDFRRALSEQSSKGFYGQMRTSLAERGMSLCGEPYDGVLFDEFDAAGYLDFIMGEFWLNPNLAAGRFWCLKKQSSASHMLGKALTGAEAFTAREEYSNWTQAPKDLKRIGDTAFILGINRYVLHTYAHQPNNLMPGFSLGRYGTHFSRTNTWWRESRAWLDYVSRAQYILQNTAPFADILVVSEGDIQSVVRNEAPSIPQGYDFEYAPARVLLNAFSSSGRVVTENKMEFSALVLPAKWRASEEVIKKILEFIKAGTPVFGSAPFAPDTLMANSETWKAARQDLAARVRPFSGGAQLGEDLRKAGLPPDFEFAGTCAENVKFIHKRAFGADFYFVANTGDCAAAGRASFRVSGKTPEIWNALDATATELAYFNADKSSLSFDVNLGAGESFFVVLRPHGKAVAGKKTPQNLRLGDGYLLGGGGAMALVKDAEFSVEPKLWNVEFTSMFGEKFATNFEKLTDWKDSPDERVRHFSGTAIYKAKFDLPDYALGYEALYMDLGGVEKMARLKINGRDLGVLWTSPYRIDVRSALVAGTNSIEIEVTNTWANRLIGDAAIKPDVEYNLSGSSFNAGRLERFPDWYGNPEKTSARKRKTFTIWKCFDADSPLQSSGLLGPITITPARALAPTYGTQNK